jgi:Rrp44-like cold shock domain
VCSAPEEPDGQPAKRKRIFPEHLNFSAVNQGIKAGRLHQGTLAVNRSYPYEGKVALKGDVKVRQTRVCALPESNLRHTYACLHESCCCFHDMCPVCSDCVCDVRRSRTIVTRFCRPEHSSKVQSVLVKGKEAMNRAFDGDVVVIELLPESQWQAPGSRLRRGSSAGTGGGTGAGGDDGDDAEEDSAARLAPVRSISCYCTR